VGVAPEIAPVGIARASGQENREGGNRVATYEPTDKDDLGRAIMIS
jgi:hypothetical protein